MVLNFAKCFLIPTLGQTKTVAEITVYYAGKEGKNKSNAGGEISSMRVNVLSATLRRARRRRKGTWLSSREFM